MSPKVAEEHKEYKRKQILEAATRVFIRKGYQKTTMKDVVEESGLSRGGVYLYYGSTEEMILDLLKEMDNELGQWTEWVDKTGSVWAVLEKVVRQTSEDVARDAEGLAPVLYELFITAWRQRTYANLLEERFVQTFEAVSDLLRKGVDRGEFNPLVPIETVTRVLFTFHDGVQLHTIQLGAELIDSVGQTEAMLICLKHLLGVLEKGEQA
jgi:AcrR family transcriptional regulator